MKKNFLREGEVVVSPFDFNQLTEWMTAVLTGRVFKLIATEADFDNEPLLTENCRLDTSRNITSIKFYSARMQILFCLDAPEDIFIPVGGFGKLSVTFLRNGFVIENKGIGKWEFIYQ